MVVIPSIEQMIERGLVLVGPNDDVISTYACPQCNGQHECKELAFRWPDVATVTGLATGDEPDDRIVVNGETYVRGVLAVPIHTGGEFAIGIWARLRDETTGWLANQLRVIAPLYGAAVRVVEQAPGLRPKFELADHPLMTAQQYGITEATAIEWRAREKHHGEPQPMDSAFEANLYDHGWELLGSAVTGRPACTESIEVGDLVKLFVRLATVDESGALKLIHAGWWLEVDHVDHGQISGTLNSTPKLPTTLSRGTRMWPRADQIYQRER